MDEDDRTLTLNAHFTFGDLHVHIHAGPATDDVQTILAKLEGIQNTMSFLDTEVQAVDADVKRLLSDQGAAIKAAVAAQQATDAANQASSEASDANTLKAIDDAVNAFDPAKPPPPSFTVSGGPFTGAAGSAITGQMSQTGGVGNVTYASTDLPAGATMDGSGVFGGSFPATPGTASAHVTGTDSNGAQSAAAQVDFTAS